MSTLFDTGLATPEVVRELAEKYAYSRDKVAKWTKEKAETVLSSCRRQKHSDLSHGIAKANEQDEREELNGRNNLNGRERVGRLEAAAYLLQEVESDDADLLLFALIHALHPLIRDELRTFAVLIVSQLKLDPATGEPLGPLPAVEPTERAA